MPPPVGRFRNIATLPVENRAAIEQFFANVGIIRHAVAVEMVTNLARATPVDTSQALSNWELSDRNDTFAFGSAHVPGSKGSTLDASVALTRAAAIRNARNIPLEKTIFIGNFAPYIRRLDQGHSQQQPNPWVRRTASATFADLPRIVRRLQATRGELV